MKVNTAFILGLLCTSFLIAQSSFGVVSGFGSEQFKGAENTSKVTKPGEADVLVDETTKGGYTKEAEEFSKQATLLASSVRALKGTGVVVPQMPNVEILDSAGKMYNRFLGPWHKPTSTLSRF